MVWDESRLGRQVGQIVLTIQTLREAGCELVCLREGVDTTTGTGRVVAGSCGVLTEFERDRIKERTKAKLESVRRNGSASGMPTGRPWLEWAQDRDDVLRESKEAGATWKEIVAAGRIKVWRSTLVREERGQFVGQDKTAVVPSLWSMRERCVD